MDKLSYCRLVLPAIVVALLFSATPFFGQTPTTSPSPSSNTGTGDYTITSSVELGVQGIHVNGDHEKYRSDLNYQPGFRIFDSSILIQDNRSARRAFDSALFQMSGWGADPSSSFRVNMDKLGIYKLDGSVRRVRYFNNLKNHVATFSQPVQTGSQHRANTLHHFGDFDLTLFPERNLRFRLGYGFNDTEGPGTSTLRFRSDEYQIDSQVKTRSDDYRVGVEGKLLGFNLGLLYGHRRFKDGTLFFQNGVNPGNNLATTTSFLNNSTRQFNVVGTTNFVNFYFQRTFAERLDVSGRAIYAESESDIRESDLLTGRASSTGDFIVSDQIAVPGFAGRPQTRADLGVTWRATRKFRLSNTFTFDQFSISGANTLSELVLLTNAAGAPLPSTLSRSSAWRSTAYQRISNLIEGDYQFSNRFSVNLGYRYTNREVFLGALDKNLLTGATTLNESDEAENSTNSVIIGSRIKPINNWTIYADAEIGEADNVFTRLANNDYVNFRVRSRAAIKQFTFDISFITKDNDSPGVSSEIFNSSGVLLFPATETVANTKTRIFSGNVEWSPMSNYSVSAGYTYTFQNSQADIIVPVGTPIFPSTQFLLGRSEFYQRDNYFYFDITANPIKRLSIYAGYRLNDDGGQGDRMITRPQDIITGYPMQTHRPEIKLAIRLTRNIDWNVGYQYHSYEEPPFVPPFVTPATVYPAQNYTAHMPYTSLRIYFGKSAADR